MSDNPKEVTPAVLVTAIVVSLGVGFGCGMWFVNNKSASPTTIRQGNRQFPQGSSSSNVPSQGIQNRFGDGFLNGEITSIDDGSITIKAMDGSSKIVLLGSSTNYHINSESSVDALEEGQKVSIVGSEDNGTVTAERVDINQL